MKKKLKRTVSIFIMRRYKKMKPLVCFVLIFCLAIGIWCTGAMALPASEATVIHTGTVREGGAPWRLYDNGTLVVDEGFIEWDGGHMRGGSPWSAHSGHIQRIVFTGPIVGGDSLQGLFSGLQNLISIDGLHYFDTGNVTNMQEMFSMAVAILFPRSRLERVDLSGWDTSNVTNMSRMFEDTIALECIDLSGWDTSNVTTMGSMFRNSRLERLDLSDFDTRNVTDMNDMFFWNALHAHSHAFRELTFGEHFYFVGNAGLLPIPQDETYTGKWEVVGGNVALTSAELMQNLGGPGTWVWQQTSFPFPDPHIPDWAREYIWEAYRRNVMQGDAEGYFIPHGQFTRAEAAKILWNLAFTDIPTAERPGVGMDSAFTDVAREWFAPAVNWAAETGIVMGRSNGNGTFRFDPNDAITREELFTILQNFAKVWLEEDATAVPGEGWPFPDHDAISDWAIAAVKWLHAAGLVEGDGYGNANPLGTANRAEVAVIVVRFLRTFVD